MKKKERIRPASYSVRSTVSTTNLETQPVVDAATPPARHRKRGVNMHHTHTNLYASTTTTQPELDASPRTWKLSTTIKSVHTASQDIKEASQSASSAPSPILRPKRLSAGTRRENTHSRATSTVIQPSLGAVSPTLRTRESTNCHLREGPTTQAVNIKTEVVDTVCTISCPPETSVRHESTTSEAFKVKVEPSLVGPVGLSTRVQSERAACQPVNVATQPIVNNAPTTVLTTQPRTSSKELARPVVDTAFSVTGTGKEHAADQRKCRTCHKTKSIRKYCRDILGNRKLSCAACDFEPPAEDVNLKDLGRALVTVQKKAFNEGRELSYVSIEPVVGDWHRYRIYCDKDQKHLFGADAGEACFSYWRNVIMPQVSQAYGFAMQAHTTTLHGTKLNGSCTHDAYIHQLQRKRRDGLMEPHGQASADSPLCCGQLTLTFIRDQMAIVIDHKHQHHVRLNTGGGRSTTGVPESSKASGFAAPRWPKSDFLRKYLRRTRAVR